MWGATLGMTWRFEPVSRLRCHRPSPIVRASATRVPNALPPDCTNTPPAIGALGSGAFPVALRAPSNAPDPIKQTAAIRSPDQGHAVPCRRWTPDLCGNRPPLTTPQTCAILVLMRLDFLSPSRWLRLSKLGRNRPWCLTVLISTPELRHSDDYPLWSLILITAWLVNWLRAWVMLREFLQGAVPPSCN